VEDAELAGRGLEGFQVVRRGEDVDRRGEREGDPRRKQSGEDDEKPDGHPELELPIHDPRATTILPLAQIPLPCAFLLF
jgi:hypothetical protein